MRPEERRDEHDPRICPRPKGAQSKPGDVDRSRRKEKKNNRTNTVTFGVFSLIPLRDPTGMFESVLRMLQRLPVLGLSG